MPSESMAIDVASRLRRIVFTRLEKLPSVVVPEIYEAALLRGIKAAPRR